MYVLFHGPSDSSLFISLMWKLPSDCTPYLLNLGLTKSNTALVWIAGPLSGLLVQPIVGVVSDQSTSRFGRRKPCMFIGTGIVALALILLGFTRDFVRLFVGDNDDAVKKPSIVLAVISIYAIDFAINAGALQNRPPMMKPQSILTLNLLAMSCSRSLVVDTLPMEKQQTGAAWSMFYSSPLPHLCSRGPRAMF